jgi:hypothetical protein
MLRLAEVDCADAASTASHSLQSGLDLIFAFPAYRLVRMRNLAAAVPAVLVQADACLIAPRARQIRDRLARHQPQCEGKRDTLSITLAPACESVNRGNIFTPGGNRLTISL